MWRKIVVKRWRRDSIKGITLIELLVVCMLIIILASFGVPAYIRSAETTKADDAAALLQTVATTARMFALDHSGLYATGQLVTGCKAPTPCTAPPGPYNACDLVACGYMTVQDFDSDSYVYMVATPVAAGNSCGAATTGATGAAWTTAPNVVACAGRKSGGVGSTSFSPYTGWGYSLNLTGVLTPTGTGTPQPVQ